MCNHFDDLNARNVGLHTVLLVNRFGAYGGLGSQERRAPRTGRAARPDARRRQRLPDDGQGHDESGYDREREAGHLRIGGRRAAPGQRALRGESGRRPWRLPAGPVVAGGTEERGRSHRRRS